MHDGSLRLTVRTIFNIYLVTSNVSTLSYHGAARLRISRPCALRRMIAAITRAQATNQTTAKAGLTQIVNSVMQRMEQPQPSHAPPPKKALAEGRPDEDRAEADDGVHASTSCHSATNGAAGADGVDADPSTNGPTGGRRASAARSGGAAEAEVDFARDEGSIGEYLPERVGGRLHRSLRA